ncbi:MAG: adenosylcobinamide-GDP ribazoletransferase [Acidimicrobiales bacterium]
MNGLRTAIGFLTRVPIGATDNLADQADRADVPDQPDEADRGATAGREPVTVGGAGGGGSVMGAAAPWFPVVGLFIGAAQGAILVGGNQILPPMPAAVIAVAAAALITGAFHHDGLADIADAFGGGWDVEQRMAILKDSRLGTYGTSALILAFATEIAVLASLDPWQGFRAVIAAHCLSRAIAVGVMFRAPLAGDGLGASYAADLTPLGAGAASLFGLVVLAIAAGGFLASLATLLLAVAAAVAVVALAVRKIGGVTGDVLGAVQQMSSLAILVAAAADLSRI